MSRRSQNLPPVAISALAAFLSAWTLQLAPLLAFIAPLHFIAPLYAQAAGAQEADDVVLRAMRDEVRRSMEKLRLEALEKPYFIAYRVTETARFSVRASFGDVLARDSEHERRLAVEVRVGSYDFDNTNFSFSMFPRSDMERSYAGVVALPLDDDYDELRRQIWLATDVAYKYALEQIAAKRAGLQNKTRVEEIPDFGKQEPARLREEGSRVVLDAASAEKLVTELSAVFRRLPAVFNSSVAYSLLNVTTRYVSSEGSSYVRDSPSVRFVALASTQADDGMPLDDFVSAYGRVPGDLPPRAELEASLRGMGVRLAELRQAVLLERYNGPVLFEGQAAAELLAQGFVPKLLARRKPVLADDRLGRMGGSEEPDFQDRIGARVLPRFMTLADDATAATAAGRPLFGGYRVDDQGVPARDTTLVERGYLKTLLTGRTPVPGVPASTGNWRGGVCPSNLFFASDHGLTDEALRKEMLLLVQDRGIDFGVIVRRIGNERIRRSDPLGSMVPPRGPGDVAGCIAAYKLYPDGREILVRNVEISGLSAANFKEIVATGDKPVIYTLVFPPAQPAGTSFMVRPGPETPLVSIVVPSLLFEELTLKKPSGEIPKPPALDHPYFASRPSRRR